MTISKLVRGKDTKETGLSFGKRFFHTCLPNHDDVHKTTVSMTLALEQQIPNLKISTVNVRYLKKTLIAVLKLYNNSRYPSNQKYMKIYFLELIALFFNNSI